jgi:hypothetical protein
MSEKPEALRLADDFDRDAKRELFRYLDLDKAAVELRRQHAEIERLREALDRSLTDEQIRQIAASIDRSMPLKSAKILFARRIEAALRREDV